MCHRLGHIQVVWEIKQLLFASELSHHLKQELMSKHIILRTSETLFCMNHFLVILFEH